MGLYFSASSFNKVSETGTSSVTDMENGTFGTAFDQNIGNWDTSSGMSICFWSEVLAR